MVELESLMTTVVDEGLGNCSYLGRPRRRAARWSSTRPATCAPCAAGRGEGRVADPFAADTHLHADFLSGAAQLAHDEAAMVLASAAGHRRFEHRGLADGDAVDLGGLIADARGLHPVIPTSTCPIVLGDGERPLGVFTGGSLIVGSAARTDLFGRRPRPGARPRPVPVAAAALAAAGPDRGVAHPRRGIVLLGPARRRPHLHHRPGTGDQPAARSYPTRTRSSRRCWARWAATRPTSPGSGRSTAAARRCSTRPRGS